MSLSFLKQWLACLGAEVGQTIVFRGLPSRMADDKKRSSAPLQLLCRKSRWLLAVVCALACRGQECASCHRAEAASQVLTGMSRTLDTAQQAEILKSHSNLTFQQKGFSYVIERKGDQSFYHVSHGQEEASIPIAWAFGLGAAGQTYLLNRGGVWYESRVSYYKDIRNLDLTVGARPDAPRNLEEAIGRELSTKGAEECFHCHATNALVKGKLNTESLTPGIHCQRCHENAEE